MRENSAERPLNDFVILSCLVRKRLKPFKRRSQTELGGKYPNAFIKTGKTGFAEFKQIFLQVLQKLASYFA